MKTVFSSLAAFGLLAAVPALAATPIESEFFYQTDEKVNMVRPQYEFNSTSFDYENANDTEVTDSEVALAYERGLSQQLALGLELGYTAGETQQGATELDRRGLNDLSFYAKGRNAWQENSSFHYGATINVSPGDKKLDVDEQDVVSGGNSLTPYVGYQWLLGSNVIGIRGVTEIGLGDRTVINRFDQELAQTGGDDTAVNLFYELPYDQGKGVLGVSGAYTYTSATEEEGTVTFEGYNSLGASVYSPYRITDRATLIGSFNYTNVLNEDIAGITLESGSNTAVNIAGRFYF